MDRSDSDVATNAPTSTISRTDSYMNPDSPWVKAVEHHKHGCCTGRYHCDGSKCPQGPVFNPAIGIPLAICTGGLSAAACGIYRGFRDHKGRKEMKKVYQQAQQQPAPSTELVTPSTVARTLSSESEKGGSNSSPGSSVPEMDGEPVASSAIAEKMDDGQRISHRIPEKMNDEHDNSPSEIDGTPIDTLPRYSELEGSR